MTPLQGVADITKDNAQMGLTRLELSGIVAPVSTTPNRKQNKQMELLTITTSNYGVSIDSHFFSVWTSWQTLAIAGTIALALVIRRKIKGN